MFDLDFILTSLGFIVPVILVIIIIAGVRQGAA